MDYNINCYIISTTIVHFWWKCVLAHFSNAIVLSPNEDQAAAQAGWSHQHCDCQGMILNQNHHKVMPQFVSSRFVGANVCPMSQAGFIGDISN